MKYFMDPFSMLLSFPTVPVAATAMAMLWGEMIFPAVDPTVLAAASQTSFIPSVWAVWTCRPVNRTLEDVALPVTKVPIEPISGATNG